jgi:hypothetical protein
MKLLYTFFAICLSSAANAQAPQWVDTNVQADWADHDFAKTGGMIPDPQQCNAGTRTFVAVCFTGGPGTPEGSPTGAGTAWCTYKSVTKTTPPNATHGGKVWSCE